MAKSSNLPVPARKGMIALDEVFAQDGMMSHQEIVERFKKVFGREMTPAERHSFFLDHVPSPEKETTEP